MPINNAWVVCSALSFIILFSCSEIGNSPTEKDNIEATVQNDSTKITLDSISILNSIAQESLQEGDTLKAIEHIRRSLSLDLNQYDIEATLCFLYAAKKDPRSIEVADRLIKQESEKNTPGRGHYLKGIYFANLGDSENAIRQFDSSIISNFTFIDAYIEKSIVLYDQRKFNEAIDLLNKALTFDRYNGDLYFWLAKNHQSNQNKPEAIRNYEQTIMLDSLNEEAKQELFKIKNQK